MKSNCFFLSSVSKRFYTHTYVQCESRGKESLISLSLSRLFYGNTSERIKVKNQGLSEITAICVSRDKLWLVRSWFQEPLNYSSVATRFPLEYQRLLRAVDEVIIEPSNTNDSPAVIRRNFYRFFPSIIFSTTTLSSFVSFDFKLTSLFMIFSWFSNF